jgi:hypothetical protein
MISNVLFWSEAAGILSNLGLSQIPFVLLAIFLILWLIKFLYRTARSWLADVENRFLKEYEKSVNLQAVFDIIGLGRIIDARAEKILDKDEATTSGESEREASLPESVIEFWDFSDGDNVLVVLPKQARQIFTDGGLKPIDTRKEELSTHDLQSENRYTLLTELLPGEQEWESTSTQEDPTVQWSGGFRDSAGTEYQLIVKGKEQVKHVRDAEMGKNETLDTDNNSYYRFDNIEFQVESGDVKFIADSRTNIDKVEEGELEPQNMREFPEHLRSAFQVVISLLREYPADLDLDYCLDSEYSNRESRRSDIVLIDIDGCNNVLNRIDTLSCSIGRSRGLSGGEIQAPDGQKQKNFSSTENGRTKVTSHGMFAHVENPLNKFRSCYVLSGTHPYATIGIAQCIAPTRDTHYDGADQCCEIIREEFASDEYFHAITEVEALNGDIRQPVIQATDFYSE